MRLFVASLSLLSAIVGCGTADDTPGTCTPKLQPVEIDLMTPSGIPRVRLDEAGIGEAGEEDVRRGRLAWYGGGGVAEVTPGEGETRF